MRRWSAGAGSANGGTVIREAGSSARRTGAISTAGVSSSRYVNAHFELGDRIRLWTPGGGYGDPKARDPELIAEDVRGGYVAQAGAGRDDGRAGARPAPAPVARRAPPELVP